VEESERRGPVKNERRRTGLDVHRRWERYDRHYESRETERGKKTIGR